MADEAGHVVADGAVPEEDLQGVFTFTEGGHSIHMNAYAKRGTGRRRTVPACLSCPARERKSILVTARTTYLPGCTSLPPNERASLRLLVPSCGLLAVERPTSLQVKEVPTALGGVVPAFQDHRGPLFASCTGRQRSDSRRKDDGTAPRWPRVCHGENARDVCVEDWIFSLIQVLPQSLQFRVILVHTLAAFRSV